MLAVWEKVARRLTERGPVEAFKHHWGGRFELHYYMGDRKMTLVKNLADAGQKAVF
jgi:hypothetical protein